MELLEAYKFTLSKVRELMDDDIQVTMTMPKLAQDKKMIERGKKEGSIPYEKWIRVTFQNLDFTSASKVHEMGNYLGMCGIAFDCGVLPLSRGIGSWIGVLDGKKKNKWIEFKQGNKWNTIL